jgi:hypothetical protein
MDLKEIMSVSGHSGLFKFVSQGRNGIIVESFVDKKRMFVSASQKVSALSDIAIFTEGEEVPLKDVMKNIHNLMPGEHAPDAKAASPDDLKQFMEKILPEYDRNRVYVSDIKKLVTWYNALLDLNLLQFEEPVKETEQNESKDDSNEAAKEEVKVKPKAKAPAKPKAKAPAKKSAGKK